MPNHVPAHDPSPPCPDVGRLCDWCGERIAEHTSWAPGWTKARGVCDECDAAIDEWWADYEEHY